jgi:hypothetical protein
MQIPCPTDASAGSAAALDGLIASLEVLGLIVDLSVVVDGRPTCPVATGMPRAETVAGGERFPPCTSVELIALPPTRLLGARS